MGCLLNVFKKGRFVKSLSYNWERLQQKNGGEKIDRI